MMKKTPADRIWADAGAFRQQVRMPALQVEGLSPEELASALAYEVEPFSAIPAAEAELAFRPVADADSSVRVFDVAEVRRRKGARLGLSAKALAAVSVAAALALAAAAFDWFRVSSQERALARDVAARAVLDAQLKELARRAEANRKASEQLRADRVAEARAQQNAEVLRGAYAVLLDALADACGESAVLRSLAPGDAPFSVRVEATGLTPQAAAETTVRLARALAPRGWKVEPGAVSADAAAGTATFSCTAVFDEGGEFK